MSELKPTFFHATGRDLVLLLQALGSLTPGNPPVTAREFVEAMRRITSATGGALLLIRADEFNARSDPVELANVELPLTDALVPVVEVLRRRVRRLRRVSYSVWIESAQCVIALVPQKSSSYVAAILKVNPADRRRVARLLLLGLQTIQNRLLDVRLQQGQSEMSQSLRDTFILLLRGSSEKEIASATHKSVNTIHDHVKRLYQHFNVASRAQLLARFVDVERIGL